MLTYKNSSIFFLLLLSLLFGYRLLFGLPLSIFLIPVFLYSLLLFYGSYRVDSGFFIKAICSAKTDKMEIAISFDDGPAPGLTAEILKVLSEQQVQAAFFCIGSRIAGNEALITAILEQGHIIGNHSYSHHVLFDLLSAKAMSEDLQLMDRQMERVTGLRPRLFRPPYGVTNPALKKAIARRQYIPIGWSIRSMDTVISDEQKLLKKVTRSLNPGAIVLFHDTSKTTLAILPEFIREAGRQGYRIVRLDKMLNLEAYV
jgi:peptidoglycan/xylan/chitin deacetylase (PgdA/CDA1 family)